jgi:16S rRNA (cytidine1402-2'-O)-methyltransferase
MGTLYIVATPIGNLEDITLRALRVLREVSLIAAEDTRRTRKLLNHFSIPTPAISYHEHNKLTRLDRILDALATGDVALVSDAGTPIISDPGRELVAAVLAVGHRVVPIPGPSALATALSAAAMPMDCVLYLGFLPRRSRERQALLARYRDLPCTLAIFEAPHRLRECLTDLRTVLGNRPAVVCQEMTKIYEEFHRGTLDDLIAHFAQQEPQGEFTLVIAGAMAPPPSPIMPDQIRERLRAELAAGQSLSAAAASVAAALGLPKRIIYQQALAEQEQGQ